MKKTEQNLVPNTQNPTPDYYCTWQTQLYATSDGKPEGQRRCLSEEALFGEAAPYGWANFYPEARRDLFLVIDDSWDVPKSGDPAFFGSLQLDREKFPHATQGAPSHAAALRSLVDCVTARGWKGLGGWVCAQEAEAFFAGDADEYWKERFLIMQEAGFAYWKVDWGRHAADLAFRRRLTELAKQYAPALVVEHAMLPEIIPYSDVFRTYDVPAIMSIPMTMEKIVALAAELTAPAEGLGLLNCEDEAYIAAAGGFSMCIMRHPYAGPLPNGRADMSFPAVHRDLKRRMYEVVRAARWHRLAPAFHGGSFTLSPNKLTDHWCFAAQEEELEAWWLDAPAVADRITGNVWQMEAPAAFARNTALPQAVPDEEGLTPYLVASRFLNGAYAVAALGRTVGRRYLVPSCDVSIEADGASTIGIFGLYRSLTVKTDLPARQVLLQDLAGERAYDITEDIRRLPGALVLPGHLITKIGTEAQPPSDLSEPGAVLRLLP